jgi:hypothetical protein
VLTGADVSAVTDVSRANAEACVQAEAPRAKVFDDGHALGDWKHTGYAAGARVHNGAIFTAERSVSTGINRVICGDIYAGEAAASFERPEPDARGA